MLEMRFSPHSFRQIDAADSWWIENRPANPHLFLAELQTALKQIQRFPTIFADLKDNRVPGLRRLLMSRTRYYVYWTVSNDAIEILAVWHTSRGNGPLDDEP